MGQLRSIALWQRLVMLAMVISAAVLMAPLILFGGADAPAWWMAVVIGLLVARGVACARLASAIEKDKGWQGLFAFLPSIFGLIALAVVSTKATKALRASGIQVGLFGAQISENPF